MHDDVQVQLRASQVVAAVSGGGFRQSGTLLRPLLVAVVAAVGADAGVMVVAEPGLGRDPHVRLLTDVGYAARELAGWERFPRSLATPLTEAMRECRPVGVEPQDVHERYPVISQVASGRALLAVPVVVAGEAVGAAGMRMPGTGPPPSAEVLTLASLALSRALEDRARLLLAARGRN